MAWLFTKGLAIPVRLVVGAMAGDGTQVRCLLIGSNLFNDDFTARVYPGNPKVIYDLRIPFFLLSLGIHLTRRQFDICLAALPSSYKFLLGRVATFDGPDLVTQIIDTSAGWDEVRRNLSRSKRTLLNNFQKNPSYGFHVSESTDDLDFFYRRMFVPYAKRRFGDVAVVDSYQSIRDMHSSGMLLQITKDGEPVAGAVCQCKRGRLYYNRAGVLDGNEELLKDGVLTALYFFQIKLAVDNGYDALDLQQSRPFLNDGVYINKARWGAYAARVVRDTTSIQYVCSGTHRVLSKLFSIVPLVVYQGSELGAVLGYTESEDPTSKEVRHFASRYETSGISCATVYTPQRTISLDGLGGAVQRGHSSQ